MNPFQEFQAFYNISNREDVSDLEILQKLNHIYSRKTSRILVMSRAHESVYIFQNGQLKTFDVFPISKQNIVDTNGAGDAFVAGFLAQYCQNKRIDECVRCGLWTSREIIQHKGCNFDKNKVYSIWMYFFMYKWIAEYFTYLFELITSVNGWIIDEINNEKL